MTAAAILNGFFAAWVNSSTFHAQHICSHASNSCRTVAHGVFAMGPELGDDLLDTLKVVGVVDGKVIGYTNWEKHVVNGVCQGTTPANNTVGRNCSTFKGGSGRVYNWGYENIGPFQPNALPESISVTIEITGDILPDDGYFKIPTATIPYETHIVTGKGNSKNLEIQYNEFSTVAFQDGDEAIFHVVFGVAPVDDPIENLTPTGEYSIDGGNSWETVKGADEMFFENHIDDKNGTFFQSFQYDLRYKKKLLGQKVCFRIRASDSQSHETQYQNCLKVCDKIVPFHNPMGYCPESAMESTTILI